MKFVKKRFVSLGTQLPSRPYLWAKFEVSSDPSLQAACSQGSKLSMGYFILPSGGTWARREGPRRHSFSPSQLWSQEETHCCQQLGISGNTEWAEPQGCPSHVVASELCPTEAQSTEVRRKRRKDARFAFAWGSHLRAPTALWSIRSMTIGWRCFHGVPRLCKPLLLGAMSLCKNKTPSKPRSWVFLSTGWISLSFATSSLW